MVPVLTPRQHRFVLEYLIDLNATQAAIRAGYSRRTARAIASENLSKPSIQDAVAQGRATLVARAEVDAEEWLRTLATLARADIRRLFTPTGCLLPPNRWPADLARCVARFDRSRHGHKVRLWDKLRALELLGRHIGLLER